MKKFLDKIRIDRTIMTFALAILLIVFMGLLRPKTITGVHEKRFWATKICWKDYADIVITGDSRVLGGISPEVMQETLKDKCIVNYGFVSNLYDSEYLEGVEKVLRNDSRRKIIILGITPHSLTKDTELAGQYSDLKNLSKKDIFIHTHFAMLFSFFEYMSFSDAINGIFPNNINTQTHKELYADGWLAFSKKDPGKKKELSNYVRIYERCQVSQDRIDNLLRYISKWKESQITVYGFLVPTCEEMYDIEVQYSGLNLLELKQAFQSSGGKWIEIDPTAYDSFDGSHLQRESAVQLSKDLVEKIFESEKQI